LRYHDIRSDSLRTVAKAAFVLGGTGQVGRAVSRRLTEAGWNVTAAARGNRDTDDLGVATVRVDRTKPGDLERVLGAGADVLVDVIPFTDDDARQLIGLSGRVGSIVAVSTAAVYADAEGRSIDTQADAFPRFPVPIRERQPTVAAGDGSYATRKVAVEQALLASAIPTTVVRPGAIQGIGARNPRELYFVKRFIDGRRFVPLAYRGATRFHTTSVENLAELVWLAAERPGRRVLNCGDPDPPTALEIGRIIAAVLEHTWSELLLPGAPEGPVGDTPWSAERSIVLDMLEAELEVRYRPVVTYERSVARLCEWLVESLRERDWTVAFPDAAEHYGQMFDYAAEDVFLQGLT
jgi:nucleoside-diphosphate-sugar epimerase